MFTTMQAPGRLAAGHRCAAAALRCRSRDRASLQVCAASHRVTVLPGDGIGPEIMKVAQRALDVAGKAEGESFEYTEALIGGAAIDATGSPYPDETLQACKASDAVLLAAIGG